MALFWKETYKSDPVTLQDCDYPGTGLKIDPGAVVRVDGLAPNRNYTFAVGGYTDDLVWVNGVGKSTDGIVPCLPLNANILNSYLAQTAFKLEHYQIAKKAAEAILTQYILKNDRPYPMLSTVTSSWFTFELNYRYINHASPLLIRQLISWFLILSEISSMPKSGPLVSPLESQKSSLKPLNFLILALECALCTSNNTLAKLIISKIYDQWVPFLSFEPLPDLLNYILVYTHQALFLIPSELYDSNLRRVAACLSYEVTKNKLYEIVTGNSPFYKRLLESQNALEIRKYRKYGKMVTKYEELSPEEMAQKQEQLDLIARGGDICKSFFYCNVLYYSQSWRWTTDQGKS